eukprot:SAG31_NODE_6502_length_1994_cov_1.297625_1_plen_41_part_10
MEQAVINMLDLSDAMQTDGDPNNAALALLRSDPARVKDKVS